MIKYNGMSTLEVLEGADNYNSWIAANIAPHTTSPVIEIGAGSGNISSHFLHKKSFTVTDVDNGLVKYLKKKFQSKKIVVEQLDIEKNVPLKYRSKFNSLFAVNVLEHIKDDSEALKNMNAMLKKNGKLILLVPANKFAYTRLDKELGHFRRYEKEELNNKLQKVGFSIKSIKFFNIVGLVTWIIRDKIEKNNVHLKPYQIAIFDKIVPVLRFTESIIPIPVGISLIVVARKK